MKCVQSHKNVKQVKCENVKQVPKNQLTSFDCGTFKHCKTFCGNQNNINIFYKKDISIIDDFPLESFKFRTLDLMKEKL